MSNGEEVLTGSRRPALRVKSRIGADIQLPYAGAVDSARACGQAGEAPGSRLQPVPALARPVTKPIRKPTPALGSVP